VHFGGVAVKFFFIGGNTGQEKGPPAEAGGPSLRRSQNGGSADSAAASVLGVAGISASARLSRRTELARTLQKTVTFAALAFV
jgi:hypothetical protein